MITGKPSEPVRRIFYGALLAEPVQADASLEEKVLAGMLASKEHLMHASLALTPDDFLGEGHAERFSTLQDVPEEPDELSPLLDPPTDEFRADCSELRRLLGQRLIRQTAWEMVAAAYRSKEAGEWCTNAAGKALCLRERLAERSE